MIRQPSTIGGLPAPPPALAGVPADCGYDQPRYAVIVPATCSFAGGLGKLLVDRHPVVRRLVGDAAEYLEITPDELLAPLDDGHRDARLLSAGRDERWLHYVRVAQVSLPLIQGLWIVLQESYGFRTPPAVLIGNSRGLFGALLLAGAIDLIDALALFTTRAEITSERWDDSLRVLHAETEAFEELGARLSDIDGGAAVFHVRRSAGGGRLVSFVGSTGEIVRTVRELEDLLVPGTRNILSPLLPVPFHTPLMGDCAARYGRSGILDRIGAPRIPVLGGAPSALLTSSKELRAEVVESLVSIVRWDRTIDAVRAMALDHCVLLPKHERGSQAARARQYPLCIHPVGDVQTVRAFKRVLLDSSQRVAEVRTAARASWAVRCFTGPDRAVVLLDGYSGAGKSHLLEAMARELTDAGRPCVTIHGGDFLRRDVADPVKHALLASRGEARFELDGAKLTDYGKLTAFLDAARSIRRGSRPPGTVVLRRLYYDKSPTGFFDREIHLDRTTVVLIEGNVLLSAELAPWIDTSVLVVTDRFADVDIERVIQRARSRDRSSGDETARYRDAVLHYRRPLVDRHVEQTIGLFDFVLDNTDLDAPVLIARTRARAREVRAALG